MMNTRDDSLSHHIKLSVLIVVMLAGCASPLNGADVRLTPLTARPEDPDKTNIVDQNDLMPSASPDGEHVLFTSRRTGTFRLWVMNRDGSNQHVLSSGPGTQMQGSWSPDGKQIAYVQRNDEKRYLAVMQADGSDPRNVTDNIGPWPIPLWSPDGTHIIYHAADESGNEDIMSIDPRGGDPVRVLGSPEKERHPSFSPDGKRIVFLSRRDGKDFDVYLADLEGGPWTRLTDNDDEDWSPSWSPDGSQIVFQSPRAGRWTIITVKPDGSEETPVTSYPMQWDPVWSSDGREIFFNSARDGRRGIYVMNDDGSYQRKLTNNEPSSFVTIVRQNGVDAAVRAYHDARKANHDAVYFYEEEVAYLGDNYLEIGDIRRARLLFEVTADAYPDSKAAQVNLARVHLAAGNPRMALSYYERAHELDPKDEAIEGTLERVRGAMR